MLSGFGLMWPKKEVCVSSHTPKIIKYRTIGILFFFEILHWYELDKLFQQNVLLIQKEPKLCQKLKKNV